MPLDLPWDEGELKGIAFAAVTQIDDSKFANTKEGQNQLEGVVTTTYLNVARQKFPNKNIVVVSTPHFNSKSDNDLPSNEFELDFKDEHRGFMAYRFDLTVEYKMYNVYIFDSGECTLHTDGGLQNWAFVSADGAPNFIQNGGHVTFFPVSTPPQTSEPGSNPLPSDTPHPLPPAPTPRSPDTERPDGVYLVNSFRGNEKSSGLAYFKNMVFGGNDGQQPDDNIDISKGEVVDWGGNHSGMALSLVNAHDDQSMTILSDCIIGRFQNGTQFTVFLTTDAEAQPINTQVGSATNTFRPMVVFKDKERILYEIDGWQVFTLFWCN